MHSTSRHMEEILASLLSSLMKFLLLDLWHVQKVRGFYPLQELYISGISKVYYIIFQFFLYDPRDN